MPLQYALFKTKTACTGSFAGRGLFVETSVEACFQRCKERGCSQFLFGSAGVSRSVVPWPCATYTGGCTAQVNSYYDFYNGECLAILFNCTHITLRSTARTLALTCCACACVRLAVYPDGVQHDVLPANSACTSVKLQGELVLLVRTKPRSE